MKSVLNALSDYFETVPARLRRKRWLVWLFFVISTGIISYGITNTKFDMTLEGWFDDDEPIKMALDDFKAEFGSDESVYIVYKPKDGNIFSEKSLQVVKGIRDDLLDARAEALSDPDSMLNHIVRINTLVNASVLVSENDSLVSSQLVGKNIPSSEEELEKIKNKAQGQKDFPLMYFSKDLQYAGLVIETDFGTIPLEEGTDQELEIDDEAEIDFGEEEMSMEVDTDESEERVKFQPTEMDDYLGLMKEINAVIFKPEYADHMEYHLVGNAPMMDYGMEVMAEMGPMYMAMIGIILVLLWFLFKSFSAVIWPISVIVLSTVWTVGITGWLDVTITTMLMLTVMLILAVGTADSIHILSGYLFFRNKGKNHEQAMAAAYKKSGLACLLTTVTTMIGMLALSFTPIEHLEVFGYMSAAGVALAFFFTIFLLPVMLDLWAPVTKGEIKEKKRGILSKIFPDVLKPLQKLLDGVLPIVQKNPYAFTGFFLALFGICIYGATQVKIDSNIIEQFKEGTKIRKVYELVDEYMMGTQNMTVLLDLKEENAFQDPFVLKAMDKLQNKIAEDHNHLVVRTSSLVNVVKDSYQTLNNNREDMYRIPDTRPILAQTLFMFNNASPDDRSKLVSDDYSKSHIGVQLHNTGSYEYLIVFDQMREDINKTVELLKTRYPETELTITGGLALIMELSDYIARSQLNSLGLVIVVISIILIFIFGSLRAGAISIIPNLLPATLTFGLLGIFKLPLDSDTMVIAPVIIGIAVDDTIHFITHYRAEVLVDGNITRALRDTIKEVGQAITFTSLILGLGFSVMAFSSHMGTANMGKFGSLAIFVALFSDLFLLPAMILIFKPKFVKKGKRQEALGTSV